ncbi:sodium:alanine symporter, partial [Diaphorobacter sp. DS2]
LGSVENASLLWALGDFGFGSMAWLNLVAILFLTKTALKVFKDYEEQRKAGIEPVFDPVKLGIKGADFWEEKAKERNSKGKKAI